MNLTFFLIQIAAILVCCAATITFTYFIVKNNLKKYLAKPENKDNSTSTLPLKLQAHERLIIFIDRINPTNLLVRLHHQGIEVAALQNLVINEIKAEFQHNITQQLYVDTQTWRVINKLKDDTIAMINNVVKNLPANAPGVELSKKILHHMSEINENPYQLTMELIKKDVQKLI